MKIRRPISAEFVIIVKIYTIVSVIVATIAIVYPEGEYKGGPLVLKQLKMSEF